MHNFVFCILCVLLVAFLFCPLSEIGTWFDFIHFSNFDQRQRSIAINENKWKKKMSKWNEGIENVFDGTCFHRFKLTFQIYSNEQLTAHKSQWIKFETFFIFFSNECFSLYSSKHWVICTVHSMVYQTGSA